MRFGAGIVIGLAVVAAIVLSAESTPSELEVWTASAMVKIGPLDAAPEGAVATAELRAARNEFESFQIVISGGRRRWDDVDVTVTDFTGPGGARITSENVAVYLERYIHLSERSSTQGGTGEWPDPLIPRTDRFVHERRSVFPFAVEASRNQPVWVEVYVPVDTPEGLYTAEAVVSAPGEERRIDVSLEVWDFTLPSTSSLRTAFGFSGVTALKQHLGSYTSDEDLYALTRRYGEAALLHRVSMYGGSMVAPPWSGSGESLAIDWSRYDREVGPFLDGEVFGPDDPLPGARATSADLRTEANLEGADVVYYWRAWVRHFEEQGWTDRLYRYLWDEPYTENYPEVIRRGRVSRQVGPEIRNLLTEPFEPSLSPVVDIWVPLINCFERRPAVDTYCEQIVPLDAYRDAVSEGKELWWYQSCASHGCTGPGGEYFRGWPSYVIDRAPAAHRIMQWLTFKYGITGELYFAMNDAYSREGDVVDNIHMYGGNGDGTFFYPGRPADIGGTTDIPIESIRLKLIREGLEDYEYLQLLSEAGDRSFAMSRIEALARTPYDWDESPATFYEVRRQLAERIETLQASVRDGG